MNRTFWLTVLLVSLGCGAPERAVPGHAVQMRSVGSADADSGATKQPTKARDTTQEPQLVKRVHFDIAGMTIGQPLDKQSLDDKAWATEGNLINVWELIDLSGEKKPEPKREPKPKSEPTSHGLPNSVADIEHPLNEDVDVDRLVDDFIAQTAKYRAFEPVKPGMVKMQYIYVDDKLASVVLTFKSELYPTVLGAYEKKFGCPPDRIVDDAVKNRAGVEYQNQTAVWITDAGEFILRRIGDTVTEGTGYLSSDATRSEAQKKTEALQNRLRDKL